MAFGIVARHLLLTSCAGAAALALGATAEAGQFKTVNTVTNSGVLTVGGAITQISSPKSTLGGTMEMEVYEFQTPPAGGGWQLQITQNNTGRALNLRLVGVNGTIITSCTTPVNGTCNTTPIGLVGNFKFLALVATDAFNPVAPGQPTYTIKFRRTS